MAPLCLKPKILDTRDIDVSCFQALASMQVFSQHSKQSGRLFMFSPLAMILCFFDSSLAGRVYPDLLL